MSLESKLLADIKQAEGLRLSTYKDSLGYLTIGYGHKINPDREYYPTQISLNEANVILESDLTGVETICIHLPEWPHLDTECRRNAVVELYFNMGSKWRQFAKARLAIQNGDWKTAHDELLNSLWAKQVGPTRSNRLANYLLTGNYPS